MPALKRDVHLGLSLTALITAMIAGVACDPLHFVHTHDRSLLVREAYVNDHAIAVSEGQKEIDLVLSEESGVNFRPTGGGGVWELTIRKRGDEEISITNFRVIAPYLKELEAMYVFRDEGPMFPQYYLRPGDYTVLQDLLFPVSVEDFVSVGHDAGSPSRAREPHEFHIEFTHASEQFYLRFSVQIP